MGNVAEYRNQVAIIGAAVVPPVRRAAVPVAGMAVRASQLAIEDAGLDPSDIDGVACGTQLPSYTFSGTTQAGRDFVDADFLINHMRLQASWRMDDDSFPPAFMFAVQAIASGMATHVLVNRTLHNPKGRYNSFGRSQASGPTQWTVPYGFVAPTSGIAMPYKEYQQRYGARRENMGKLVVQQRKNVQRIPDAYWHGTELTLDDYMNCRMISEPMCLLDNDIPVDGSGSFVLTTAERGTVKPTV
ncbi:hypothetical protein [Pseudonocardia sp. N23]|uniref:hypothetical protein n=1 Tax=Pseudonocardia sp. N23 TaxID=1987376 RepID=UPI000BFDE5A2|nr:hypothetical protein [Pseudonocardia sp. N23]GAY10851.1 conserved hypothetical protein [Pseudonocardia sp. N23]